MRVLKWRCGTCGKENIDDSSTTHTMHWCSCKESATDVEEEYSRLIGNVIVLEEISTIKTFK